MVIFYINKTALALAQLYILMMNSQEFANLAQVLA